MTSEILDMFEKPKEKRAFPILYAIGIGFLIFITRLDLVRPEVFGTMKANNMAYHLFPYFVIFWVIKSYHKKAKDPESITFIKLFIYGFITIMIATVTALLLNLFFVSSLAFATLLRIELELVIASIIFGLVFSGGIALYYSNQKIKKEAIVNPEEETGFTYTCIHCGYVGKTDFDYCPVCKKNDDGLIKE